MKQKLFILILCIYTLPTYAQKINDSFRYNIQATHNKIKVDGILDDEAWKAPETAKNFWMITPIDTAQTNAQTTVKLTYDENFLYVSAICYEKVKGQGFIVESLKRDFTFGNNDNFWVILEPFNDLTNGFVFGVNAAGAQFDGIVSEGTVLNPNWDNKWYSATKYFGDYWTFEAAIPFKTLRYKAGETNWGINFSRLDLKSGEKSSWAKIPRQFPSIILGYTGVLAWDKAPPVAKSNISIIPYALGGLTKNYANGSDVAFLKEVGLDAKVAVSSSLNLDLTVNPDFSQVDVDQQVTNLSRFEIFFPERRQFFLENGDLFNNFGLSSIRPFFSRRIGTPIQFGARLSGKINNNLRIGAMDIQTGAQENRPTQNFAALVLQQKVFKRSSVGMMLLSKQAVDYNPELNKSYTEYNRNIGLEYNLASATNAWTGKALFLKSFSPTLSGDDFTNAYYLNYTDKTWIYGLRYEYVGANYNPEMGYVPRRGYHKITIPEVHYLFYTKRKDAKLLYWAPFVTAYGYWNKQGVLTDLQSAYGMVLVSKNRAYFNLFYQNDFIKLPSSFDPTNQSSTYLLIKGSEHHFQSVGLQYTSTSRKRYTFSLNNSFGSYLGNGKLLELNGEVGYRFQPFVSISSKLTYVNMYDVQVLGENDKVKSLKTQFWLISPKIDVTFNNKLFLTTFIQYNEQAKNVNINSRLQWRYKPVSDIFLVYSDNYLPGSLTIKDRSIILKMTYWWNL